MGKLKVSIVIGSASSRSRRGLEALRVAAGLAAAGRFEVTLVFLGEASVILDGNELAKRGEDEAETHLQLLRDAGAALLAAGGVAARGSAVAGAERCTEDELALRLAKADRFMRF